MTDKETRALIPVPSGGLVNIGTGPQSILSGMVSDALTLARRRENSMAEPRFRIGDYEFRDPDYRQILIWAESLGLAPDEVILRLAESVGSNWETEMTFRVQAGRILSFVWDFDLLPISSFDWLNDLRIERISFRRTNTSDFIIRLDTLRTLHCPSVGLSELDLSCVPNLIELGCGGNQLTELDLSCVPSLTKLNCYYNQLTELDLQTNYILKSLLCDKEVVLKNRQRIL